MNVENAYETNPTHGFFFGRCVTLSICAGRSEIVLLFLRPKRRFLSTTIMVSDVHVVREKGCSPLFIDSVTHGIRMILLEGDAEATVPLFLPYSRAPFRGDQTTTMIRDGHTEFGTMATVTAKSQGFPRPFVRPVSSRHRSQGFVGWRMNHQQLTEVTKYEMTLKLLCQSN